ncbi:TrkH family potassium uptake protein [Elusimicrobiota bacterium]
MPSTGKNYNPSRSLIYLFIIVIIFGTLSLKIPGTTVNPISTIDALFTATSAVCVTGLTVKDTGTFFTPIGKVIILLLIQIGALGYMSLASLIVLLLRRGMNIKGKLLVKKQMSGTKSIKLHRFILRVVILTVTLELLGAVVLILRMGNIFDSFFKTAAFGIFHSVSAFCNAGFDIFGKGVSLTPLSGDPVAVMLISLLIIVGGIGYIVIDDVIEYFAARLKKKNHGITVHTKIVLTTTVFLLLFGTIIYYLAESGNPATMGNMALSQKWLMSFFQAVTPRTAGFSMIDTSGLINFSIIFTIILMFIGASPGGTGGGIKTTTFAIVVGNIKSIIQDKEDMSVFKRRVAITTIKNSVAIFSLGIFFIVIVTLFISVFENFSIRKIIFEVTSAFGTVGLSTGITDDLKTISKLLIILTMFFGRLGPLTIGSAILRKTKKVSYRYPEQEVAVG